MKSIHRISNRLQDLDIRGARMLSVWLPKLLLPLPRGPLVCPVVYGFSLKINPRSDTGVEHSLYYHGAYERGTLDVLGKLLRRGDHFVDVGANIGLMSVFAARIVGQGGTVSAFEPHPFTVEILRENIVLNALSNIEVYPAAAGSTEGVCAIADGPEGNRGASYTVPAGSEQGLHTAAVVRTDEVLKDKPLPEVVKIDAEGDETEVLEGMEGIFGKARPAIIVESSRAAGESGPDHISRIFDMLTAHGYRIFRGQKGKGVPSPLLKVENAADMPHHDNVYGLTEVHLERLR